MDFLIIAQPRVGTFFLRDILSKSDEICWYEKLDLNDYNLFLKNIDIDKSPVILEYIITNYIKRQYILKNKKFMGNIFNLLSCKKKGLYNIDIFKIIEIFFKLNKNLKIILLSRKDILQQFVSFKLEEEKYKSLSTEEKKKIGSSKSKTNFQVSINTINCNFYEFQEFAYKINFLNSAIFKIINNLQINFLDITYEDLVSNSVITLAKIQSFLNLKSALLSKSKFFKLETRPINKIINNWSYFEYKLKNSEFHYLIK